MALQKPRFGGAHNMEVSSKKEQNEDTQAAGSPPESATNEIDRKMAETTDERRFLLSGTSSPHGHNDKHIQDEEFDGTEDRADTYILSKPESGSGFAESGGFQTHESINSPTVPLQNESLGKIHKDTRSSQSPDSLVEGASGLHVEKLLKVFRDLGIQARPKPYTRLRDQVNSEGECIAAENVYAGTPGCNTDDHEIVYCKNLFLKDRKGQFYVIVLPENAVSDLKKLKQQLSAYRNLSFADENALSSILQVKSGAVTPLAIMHDTAGDVRVAVHSCLSMTPETNRKLAFHPLDGTKQIEITFSELRRFCQSFGKTLEILADNENDDDHRQKCTVSVSETKSNQRRPQGNRQDLKESSQKPNHDRKKRKRKDGEVSIQAQKDYEGSDNLEKPKDSFTVFEEVTNEKSDTQDQGLEQPALLSAPVMKQRSEVKNVPTDKEPKQDKLTTKEDGLSEQEMFIAIETRASYSSQKDSEPLTVDNSMMRFKWYDRKGKLKSYLKKSCSTKTEKSETEHDCLFSSKNINDENNRGYKTKVSYDENKRHAAESSASETYGESASAFSLPNKPEGRPRMTKAERLAVSNHEALLPEVQQFYRSLEELNVSYKEVDLACSDSITLGPSVGCRCFLLKDIRKNFYFIITHEFYELDYGRLKKALKPRKKIVNADAEEIMTALGVDPTRMTPFAYPTRNWRDIRIFFTNKIRPAPLVLSIQHPFAPGHRIVIKSSEMQRYLSLKGAVIEHVEEKHWPARYNGIFSQFDPIPVNASLSSQRKEKDEFDTSTRDHSTGTEVPETTLSEAPYQSGISSFSFEARRVQDIVRCLLPTSVANTICSVDLRTVAMMKNRKVNNVLGTSVDPPESDTGYASVGPIATKALREDEAVPVCHDTLSSESIKVANDETRTQKTESCETEAYHQNGARSIAYSSKLGGASPEEYLSCSDSDTEINSSRPSLQKHRMREMTIERIAVHLTDHDVKFFIKMSPKASKEKEVKYNHDGLRTCITDGSDDTNAHKKLEGGKGPRKRMDENDPFYEAYTELSGDITTDGSREHLKESDDKEDDDNQSRDEDEEEEKEDTDDDDDDEEEENCVENCSVVHLQDDDGTIYLIIGGESDRISKKRFCRRFQVHKKLTICYDSFAALGQKEGLRQTPFSVAMLNTAAMTSTTKGVKVVLTTSIYIDPDTVLKFTLDGQRSSLIMTSNEFERYARIVGFDIWYMP